jgi:uncharacterized protein YcbK (DUF882 family)
MNGFQEVNSSRSIQKQEKGVKFMVNVYFMSVDGNVRLSEHFKLSEFQCKDGQDFVAVDSRLVELLENIRKVCGDAVHINSGFRTASWNRQQKGSAPHSKHLYGLAADIWVGHYDKMHRPVRTKTPAEVAAIAEIFLGNSGGIGIYKTFTHVDVRTGSSRWKG